MLFLANENFPFPSVKILWANGHEVSCIFEDSPGWRDVRVLERAVRDDLIILTFDKDYGELIFRHKRDSPPAVVYFRFKGQDPEAPAIILLQKILDGLQIENNFTVLEETGIRQRKLR